VGLVTTPDPSAVVAAQGTPDDTKGAAMSEARPVKVMDREYGMIHFETPGVVPHVERAKIGWWGTAVTWLDADGAHVWVAHDCTEGRDASMLPWPTWQADREGYVQPSIFCRECGLHTFMRVDAEVAS